MNNEYDSITSKVERYRQKLIKERDDQLKYFDKPFKPFTYEVDTIETEYRCPVCSKEWEDSGVFYIDNDVEGWTCDVCDDIFCDECYERLDLHEFLDKNDLAPTFYLEDRNNNDYEYMDMYICENCIEEVIKDWYRTNQWLFDGYKDYLEFFKNLKETKEFNDSQWVKEQLDKLKQMENK